MSAVKDGGESDTCVQDSFQQRRCWAWRDVIQMWWCLPRGRHSVRRSRGILAGDTHRSWFPTPQL